MSAKSAAYINFITDELKKGNVEFTSVHTELNRTKLKLGKTQFTEYWKEANEAYKIEQGAINEQKSKEYTQSELERVKSNILDRDKALEMQTNVAKLVYNKMAASKIPASADVMAFNNTIERLAKLQGWDAPKQVEQKNMHDFIGMEVEYRNDNTKFN